MSEVENFDSKDELEDWLKRRGVDDDDVVEAANKLFEKEFNRPSRILGITVEELKIDVGIKNTLARELNNKRKHENWQPHHIPQ